MNDGAAFSHLCFSASSIWSPVSSATKVARPPEMEVFLPITSWPNKALLNPAFIRTAHLAPGPSHSIISICAFHIQIKLTKIPRDPILANFDFLTLGHVPGDH